MMESFKSAFEKFMVFLIGYQLWFMSDASLCKATINHENQIPNSYCADLNQNL